MPHQVPLLSDSEFERIDGQVDLRVRKIIIESSKIIISDLITEGYELIDTLQYLSTLIKNEAFKE